jgi:phosphate transport system substrate-binding protein
MTRCRMNRKALRAGIAGGFAHAALVAAVMVMMLPGCTDRQAETPTRGHVSISVSEEVLPLIREEEARFEELYSEASIDVRPRPAREAIAELFSDSVKMIVSARPLNDEERAAQKALNLEVNEFRIAIDAVVVIVNDANDVTKLTLPQLDSVFTGRTQDWGLLGWKKAPGKIALMVPDRNLASYEVFAGKVLHGGTYAPPAKAPVSPSDMIAAVAGDPSAIGIVGLDWMKTAGPGVRIVDLQDPEAPDSLGIRGKYFHPYQAYIYKQFYPLTRNVYIYTTPDSYGVASGFTSFITSAAGQKIVQNQGLVPATMPVRLVELKSNNL